MKLITLLIAISLLSCGKDDNCKTCKAIDGGQTYQRSSCEELPERGPGGNLLVWTCE